ncbi:MAG: hypothetical protein EOM59_15985 [Clostridia bacterium]|jgi:hypothetical protein|nr:hypothetical protein [Bacteroidales bacterium]MDD4232707.1 hypothetical protein [Candidatus Cloacimonadota bacterium]MDD4742894.1 hypothetical protein [Bacteroidales bacterium]NCB44097.1 hypothetical protein [Clostridia bacterium]
MRKIPFLFLILCNVSVFSQIFDTIYSKHHTQNCVILSKDAIYKCHLDINEKGQYNFYRDFVDTLAKRNSIIYEFHGKGDNRKTYIRDFKIEYANAIDTIKDFFTINKDTLFYKDTIIEEIRKFTMIYYSDLFTATAKMSYILSWLGDNSNFVYDQRSVICVIPFPFETKMEEYWICKFKPYEKKSSNLYLYIIKSSDLAGFKIYNIDSVYVGERKLKKLSKALRDIQYLKESNFCVIYSDKPILIAMNKKRLIYSRQCLTLKGKTTKEVDNVVGEFFKLTNKYFY